MLRKGSIADETEIFTTEKYLKHLKFKSYILEFIESGHRTTQNKNKIKSHKKKINRRKSII